MGSSRSPPTQRRNFTQLKFPQHLGVPSHLRRTAPPSRWSLPASCADQRSCRPGRSVGWFGSRCWFTTRHRLDGSSSSNTLCQQSPPTWNTNALSSSFRSSWLAVLANCWRGVLRGEGELPVRIGRRENGSEVGRDEEKRRAFAGGPNRLDCTAAPRAHVVGRQVVQKQRHDGRAAVRVAKGAV